MVQISIIIPVYNAERYLADCVESVLNQSYTDFELILVDDGSTDGSLSVCSKYRILDRRISVLHMENGGIFQARRRGIDCAKGEFVTFLDADDWIEKNALEKAIECLVENPEIDLLSYEYFNSSGVEKNLYKEGIYNKEKIEKEIIDGMMFDHKIGQRRLNPSLCTKYIRCSIVKEIVGNVTARVTLGEDALVTYPAVCMAKKIALYHQAFYHYTNNETSSTHVIPLQSMEYVANFQENITEIMERLGYRKRLEDQIACYTRHLLSMVVNKCYGIELSSIAYKFPAARFSVTEKVAVYGAGVVGKSYIKEIVMDRCCILSGWYDRQYQALSPYMDVKVENPDDIADCDFDKIVIAIVKENVAEAIKEELIHYAGVPEEKIFWNKPIKVN